MGNMIQTTAEERRMVFSMLGNVAHLENVVFINKYTLLSGNRTSHNYYGVTTILNETP